jgi:excisionase family DNA binding protein
VEKRGRTCKSSSEEEEEVGVTLGRQQVASMARFGYATVEAVAKILGVEVCSVYRYVRSGRIRGAKVGAGIYVSLDSLDEYLRSSDPPAPPEILAAARRLRIDSRKATA